MNLIEKLKPQFLFKTDKAPDLKKFVGETVLIPGHEKPIAIRTIVGNRFKQAFYEINGEHLIGILRFHAQMCGAKDITEEQFLAFENMELDAEKLPAKKSALEVPHGSSKTK